MKFLKKLFGYKLSKENNPANIGSDNIKNKLTGVGDKNQGIKAISFSEKYPGLGDDEIYTLLEEKAMGYSHYLDNRNRVGSEPLLKFFFDLCATEKTKVEANQGVAV